MSTLPAHRTKHVRNLAYPHLDHTFYLVQNDDGHSNGTALWLGAQILSFYSVYHLRRTRQTRPRAVELGSGVGLTALVLGALGYDVLATDTPHVCDAVLRHNIAVNLPHLPPTAGSIQVRELDWRVDSDSWTWNDATRITPKGNPCETNPEHLLGPPFDVIISSDTLYDMSLVQPFFRTVQALAAYSHKIDPLKPILFLLSLERRDARLIDEALACAPVPLVRVPNNKVRKTLERAGIRWDRSDWEGVEIWKGTLR